MFIAYAGATSAWEQTFARLDKQRQEGFIQPSRAGNVVGELINQKIVITDPTQGIVMSPLRNMDIRYALGELMFYLSGSNTLGSILPYSKFWAYISDDGDTINSAYGHRIKYKFGFDQWEYVKYLFLNDPLTRQAVIHIKDANDEPTKDTPCTLSLQFLLRDNKLHLSVTMRSNDIWLGFPYDVFCFTALQVKMAMELGVELGHYDHNVGSLHLYEKDVKKVEANKSSDQVAKG